MPDQKTEFKIWLPRVRTTFYSVEIDGVDVTTEILSAEFVSGIIGIDTSCKVTLIDPDGTYARLYTGNETIEYFADFLDGTRSNWKGTLEMPKRQFGDNYTLELIGSHYQSKILDVTVTEEYNGEASCDEILINLINTYLPGYTYTNVASSSVNPTIKWSNKPLGDCIIDLCDQAGFDAYIDSDKDFHFFEKESIENTNDAIVWNDNLLNIVSFGADNLDIRNRIIVYGEDETGLPIVYQADDTASQSTNGIKEKIVKDSSIRKYDAAKELGDALLATEKSKANKGELRCLLMPYLKPGDMTWFSHPVQDIHGTYRVVKYISKIPDEITNVIISKDENIPTIFKDRKNAELASENLTNPYKMTGSLNLTFDDDSEYDSSASSGITVTEGNLRTDGGAAGTMVSNRRTETSDITNVHLKAVGDAVAGTLVYVSTSDGGSWELVSLDSNISLASPGRILRIKIVLASADTRIDSIVAMYK